MLLSLDFHGKITFELSFGRQNLQGQWNFCLVADGLFNNNNNNNNNNNIVMSV